VAAYIGRVLVDVCMLQCLGIDCTETCQSYFYVNFNIVSKLITCAFIGE
jgi:hypothetical protein